MHRVVTRRVPTRRDASGRDASYHWTLEVHLGHVDAPADPDLRAFLRALEVRTKYLNAKCGATVELAPGAKQQTSDYDDATKTVTWLIRKFPGGSVQAVSCKFVVKSAVNVHKEMGPVSLAFEIPMYNISQLQVQHLKIVERNKAYNPHRWVRCLTHAESYVCRV